MTTEITCYACANEATGQCPRCGRLYCDEHGEALCAACLDPASAVPSAALYRGSLLALIVAAILAFWLLVLAPGRGTTGPPPALLRTSSTAIAEAEATVTPPTPVPTPLLEMTVAASSPTPPGTSPTPLATPTPAGAQRYVVQPGDTLSAIAARFKPANENPRDYINRLARYNNLDPEATLRVGQVILIPPE